MTFKDRLDRLFPRRPTRADLGHAPDVDAQRFGLRVVEGVSGCYHYHLRTEHAGALCGTDRVMATRVPISARGFCGHLNESYCLECERRGARFLPAHTDDKLTLKTKTSLSA